MSKKLININYFIFLFIIALPHTLNAGEIFDRGKQIFLGDGNCAACHTLQEANSKGNIGPNLDEIKPGIARIIHAVTNGIGVMPAYDGILSTEDIKAVATYINESTN